MRRYVLPTLGDCVFISIFVGALLLGSRMLNTDSDLGRHLTLGNYILETSSIPVRDILSFTKPGESRPPYEWLSQVAFALAGRILSFDGVVILTALVIALTFLVVYRDGLERSGAPILAALFTTLAGVASSLHWLTRPHVFSLLLFAMWMRGLERIRTQAKFSTWVLPFLMVIWANTHGGFVVGLLAWGAYTAGWLWETLRHPAKRAAGKKLLLAGATSLLASVVTPDLWRNWEAVLQNRSAYILERTVETMPPQLAAPGTWPFLVLLMLTAVLFVRRRHQLIPAHAFLLGAIAAMSLAVARNIPFFAIAAAPILTAGLAQSLAGQERWVNLEAAFSRIEAGARGFLWALLVVAGVVGWISYHRAATQDSIYHFDARLFPVAAANWLELHPVQGRMFNDFNWGGYLLYRLWPQQRVFIDSQSDFYGEELTRQYEQVVLGQPGWQGTLDRYGIKWIIVPPTSGLSQQVRQDSSWELLYDDGTASILAKRQTP
jgi:hypothetical protein